jgi:hypothetical protein
LPSRLAAASACLLLASGLHAQAGDAPPPGRAAPTSSPTSSPAPAAAADAAALALPACSELRQRGGVTPALFHGKWQGRRAGKPVLLYFKNNPEMPGSLIGEYRYDRRTIELAGDNEGLALNLEESDNGRDVTGVWELKLCNRRLVGQWLDANYANAQPVELRRVGPEPRR